MVPVILQLGPRTPAASPLPAPQKAHEVHPTTLHPRPPDCSQFGLEMDLQSCVAFRDKDSPEGYCTLAIPNSSVAKRPCAS